MTTPGQPAAPTPHALECRFIKPPSERPILTPDANCPRCRYRLAHGVWPTKYAGIAR